MNNQGFYGLLHKTILNLVLSQHHDAQARGDSANTSESVSWCAVFWHFV